MMTEEEKIKQVLTDKFSYLQDKIVIKRARRIFLDVDIQKFPEVLDHAVKTLGFSMLTAITGLDEGDRFGLIYHLALDAGIMLNIKTSIPKEGFELQTVTGYFPSADVYEREMVDLLGINVKGLPKGNRYPLPDNWPAGQYPLRKGWKSDVLDQDKKET
jgi:membrane-bound hydrogenase subunit beta